MAAKLHVSRRPEDLDSLSRGGRVGTRGNCLICEPTQGWKNPSRHRSSPSQRGGRRATRNNGRPASASHVQQGSAGGMT